jgi:methylase of polypeptide subunit release factors
MKPGLLTANHVKMMFPVLPDFLRNVFQNGEVKLTNFLSVDDTCLTILTAHEMILRALQKDNKLKEFDLFELCFGSGLASYSIMLDIEEKWGLKAHCVGVEVEPGSVAISRKNAEVLGLGDAVILKGSILDKDMLQKIPALNRANRPTMFVINPPYVPMPDYCPSSLYINGSVDGTYFYDSVVFDYLNALNSPDASLLFSSICDVRKVLGKISQNGYHIVRLKFCVVPFGRYTSNATQFILNKVPNNYVCSNLEACKLLYSANALQLLIGAVISKDATEDEMIADEDIISLLECFRDSGLEQLADHPVSKNNIWKLDDYELQEANERYKCCC